MATQIKLRRDTSTNWTANDPTLSEGEVAFETDSKKLKIGDGATTWTLLPYFTGSGGITDLIGGAGVTVSGTGVVTLDVGAGTGITVNADNIAVDMTAFSTTNLAEGTNLYYTDARVDTRLSTKTTTDVAEGTNLYYTQARFDSALTAKSTTDLSEGTNLYYTDARFDTRLGTKTTTDVAEGTNLYHTDARARAAISVSGDLSYNSTTGVISYTDPAGITVINDLTDVVITTPSNGQVLSYNGTNWVNGAAGGAPVDSVNSQTGVIVLTTTDIAEGTNLYYTDARVTAAVTANAQKLQQFSETVSVVGNTSGAVSLDCANGSIFDITLIGDVTSLALTNTVAGSSSTIVVRQDATGSRLLTAGASWKWAGGTNTLSTAAGAVDIISVVWDGTTYWASLTTAYA